MGTTRHTAGGFDCRSSARTIFLGSSGEPIDKIFPIRHRALHLDQEVEVQEKNKHSSRNWKSKLRKDYIKVYQNVVQHLQIFHAGHNVTRVPSPVAQPFSEFFF